MYQRSRRDGDDQPSGTVQQPTYVEHQANSMYYPSTRMTTIPDLPRHNINAYAMAGCHPQHATEAQTRYTGPDIRYNTGNVSPVPPFETTIPYYGEGVLGFGFEGNQMNARPPSDLFVPDLSCQSQVTQFGGSASYPATPQEQFHSPNPRRFSAPEDFLARHMDPAVWNFSNPNPIPYPAASPPTATSDIEIESPVQRVGEHFIQDSFPADTEEHERLRAALTKVMNSGWKLWHTMEPDEDLLLQFTQYDRRDGRWSCRFSRDGKLCDCSTCKKDHAKGHVRWHIDHRPFYCGNPCPAGDSNCTKQYTAMESLKKHQNGKAKCKFCGASMLKGNLQRHRLSSCKAPPG